MQEKKQEVEIKPLAPSSDRDRLIALLVCLLIGSGSFLLGLGQFGFCITILLSGAVLIVLKNRRVDREARKGNWLLFSPLFVGLAVSFYPFSSFAPAVIGFGITMLVVMWFGVFRYPPELRSALKYWRGGEILQALQWANLAIEKFPNSTDAYQLRSVVNINLFKYLEAERDARAALNLKPHDHTNLMNLGNALYAQSRLAEADEAFSEALEIAPVYGIHHYHKGFICYRLGEFDAAVRFFRSAFKRGMPFAQSYLMGNYYLANSLLSLGKSEEAQQAFTAMRQYAQEYPKLIFLYRDAPDYPAIVQLRAELGAVGKYLA